MRRPRPARDRTVGFAAPAAGAAHEGHARRAALVILTVLGAVAGCERHLPDGTPARRAPGAPSGATADVAADVAANHPAGGAPGARPDAPPAGQLQGWCAQPPRSGHEPCATVPVAAPRFRGDAVAPGVVARHDPCNAQEVIASPVRGARGAFLFDTRMGMGRIGAVGRPLTDRPVTVLDSRTHRDQVVDNASGNTEFATALGMDTDDARRRARGTASAEVAEVAEVVEVADEVPPPPAAPTARDNLPDAASPSFPRPCT